METWLMAGSDIAVWLCTALSLHGQCRRFVEVNDAESPLPILMCLEVQTRGESGTEQ